MGEDVLTVCDGIGAVHEAWKPLRWEFVLTSEIDAFPREVLAIRQAAIELNAWLRLVDRDAKVPMWGDFTAIRIRHLRRFGIRLPSVLAGGTPCQAFSVAGLRKSLDDARGNLTLAFVRLANAIDALRRRLGLKPLVIVWENVPGVLSVRDNAFGCFLAGLVGEDAPLVPGRGQRWTNAGLVVGPQRAAAWIVRDAQYFGLAQRRRRVFVVSSAREGFDPAAVLFEPDCLFRDSPPSRQAGQGTAASLTASTGGISQKDGIDGRVVGTLAGGSRAEGGFSYDDVPIAEVAETLRAGGNTTGGDRPPGTDADTAATYLVPVPMARYVGNAEGGAEDLPFLTAANLSKHVNNQTPLVAEPVTFNWAAAGDQTTLGYDEESQTSGTITAYQVPAVVFPINADALRGEGTAKTPSPDAEGRVRLRDPGLGLGDAGDPAGTLNAAGPGAVAIAFGSKDSGGDAEVELSPTLRAGGFDKSHANAGVPPAVAFVVEPIPFDTTQITHPENRSNPQPGDPSTTTLAKGGHPPAIAFALRGREDGALPEIHGDGDTTGMLRAADGGSSRDYVAGFTVSQNAVGFAWEGEVSATLQARAETPTGNQFNGVRIESEVRRLMPVECERLQGFRDGYTEIRWKGKPPADCPDGPRYKALGNSMAVPVMAWLGFRIENEERRRTGLPLLPDPGRFDQPHYDEHVRAHWADEALWEAADA